MDHTLDFAQALAQMRSILRDAWLKGFVAGFSGNASMRLEDGKILVTASGAAKGRLGPENVCLLGSDGQVLAGGKPSSETKLHLALYAARTGCHAILHTHPPKLLALALILDERKEMPKNFLNLPLFEAHVALKGLAFTSKAEPGSPKLAGSVALAAGDPAVTSIWLAHHGLCSLAANLSDALAQTEELEHLAGIQLAVNAWPKS